MSRMENIFSWSHSAAMDFEACRRRRYWSKYAMWGGWEPGADEEQRTAYRLSKMSNLYALMGMGVETGVHGLLNRLRAGARPSAQEAYAEYVRPLLNRCWQESKQKAWREDPKKFCCLREHYYRQWTADEEKKRTGQIKARACRCLQYVIDNVWPRLKDVSPEQEVPLSAGGTLESFTIEGFKIYAIPDYVYRTDGIWHIHDWKAGRPRPEHADQLAVYGLWAHLAHGVDPAAVRLHAEYLSEGRTLSASYSVAEMERIKQRISDSVAAMCEYLEGGDPQCNRPIARELWDLAVDGSVCRWCNYYELCLPELRSVT